MATTGEGEASGGSVATAGGDDDEDGGDAGRPATKRHKTKRKGGKARRTDAAKGR